MSMNLENKRILVTGADGFIGSHLTEMLLGMECRVRALAYYNSFNYLGWLEGIPSSEKLEIVRGDIRDAPFCNEITRDIDIIFHLAALIAIPYSYVAPDSYVATNITGTTNICQAARANNVGRIIHTSTSEVYGTAQYTPIDESHKLQPQSPYSASKIGADALALSFHYSFNLPLIIARPFNTYGPRQSIRAVIPTIITQLAAGKKDIFLGNPDPTRDFNYVSDTCGGLIALATSENAVGETVNIGTNSEISIRDLFDTIQSLMGTNANLQEDKARLRPENSEVFRLRCDNSKMKELTGFTHEYELREGLQKTISWYTRNDNLKLFKTDGYHL